jgi:hypothetical protein
MQRIVADYAPWTSLVFTIGFTAVVAVGIAVDRGIDLPR